MQTIEQKIAQKEAEIARLKEKRRALENGQKIIIGGMMLQLAKKNPEARRWLIQALQTEVTREADRKRIAPLIVELQQQ